MLARLISLIAGPLIKALINFVMDAVKKNMAENDIESLRKEKREFKKIANKLHSAKILSDDESSKIAGDITRLLDNS